MPRAEREARTPRPAYASPPPELTSATEASRSDAFLLRGGLVDAWFERRSDVLLVTFDNLATVGEYDPPHPWLHARAAQAGASILGILAHRKDWYRNPDTPALLTRLREAGLFSRFRRVAFAGASMGGYAALAYSALLPGSVVLAFSPQTSLAPHITPFERRFRYGQRKWNWSDPAFLDAVASVPAAAEVIVVYDPFVPEDRAHARRIAGANVREVRVGHLGHKAIRHLKTLGVLQPLIEEVVHGHFHPLGFWTGLRRRRHLAVWRRSLLAEADRRGHPALARAAMTTFGTADPGGRMDNPSAPATRPQGKLMPGRDGSATHGDKA